MLLSSGTRINAKKNNTNSNNFISTQTDNTKLDGYNLKDVSIGVENVNDLGTRGSERFYSSSLKLRAKNLNNLDLKTKDLGVLYLQTNSSGQIESCNSSSLGHLVECNAGEVKISQGKNQLPNCENIVALIKKHAPAPASEGGNETTDEEQPPSYCNGTNESQLCNTFASITGRYPAASGFSHYKQDFDQHGSIDKLFQQIEGGINNQSDCLFFKENFGRTANSPSCQ